MALILKRLTVERCIQPTWFNGLSWPTCTSLHLFSHLCNDFLIAIPRVKDLDANIPLLFGRQVEQVVSGGVVGREGKRCWSKQLL